MQTKNKTSIIRKTFYVIMLLSVFVSAFGANNSPSAQAQPSVNILNLESQFSPLISNSLFLYASTVLDFDTQNFLDQQSGTLKDYSEEIDGQVWTAAESIEYNAVFYGINPQLILVILEMQNHVVTQNDAQIPLRIIASGELQEDSKFFYHVKWLSEIAVQAFNARRDGEDNGQVIFESGEIINVPLDLNAGTYGVQILLSKLLLTDQWLTLVAGSDPLFKQSFFNWFGNSMLDPDTQDISAQALPGGYNLPFPVGSTWYYTGGPHHYCGFGYPSCSNPQPNGRPWSSADFAPPEVTACSSGSTTYNASRWIVAARGGTVITSQTALVVIDHGDGWRTYYSHVSTTDRRGTGGINQGDNLGHPSCQVEPGGSTSGIHVHFAIYQVGVGFVNISGSSLSGWSITETSHYNGTMTRQGVTRTATTGRHNGTNDILNSGSGSGNACPGPSLSSPADGHISSSQTITFSWSGLSGCTFNGYTFRINDSSNMDDSPIIDTGEGNTSRSQTIGSEWNNRDLWWGVRAANAPDGASWSTRRFRIEPGSVGCPSVSGEVRLYDSTDCTGEYVFADGTGVWDMASVFNDRAESIAIPSGWSARLYQNDNENSNESACFGSTDTNLNNNTYANGGNVGNSATWMRVYNNSNCTGSTPPNAPSLGSPSNGQYFNEGESINLSWSATGSEYYGEITGGPSTLTFGWQSGTSNNIGSQWAGYTYSWHIKAKNSAGESGWSETRTFTVRPGAPTNLSASTASCSQINLSWYDNSGNEEGYKVYRNGSLIATLGSGVTSFQNTGLSASTNYSYTVKAYRGSIESNSSNTASTTTSSCGLSAPTLNAPSNNSTINRTDSVSLSWNTVPGATQYYIEFWGGPSTNINSGWVSNTSWNLGSQWGGIYQWRAKAKNSSGQESGWSETRTLNIKSGTPSNLSGTTLSSDQIRLTWSASSDAPNNIDGYRIYRNGAAVATVTGSTTTYQNNGLSCNTSYSFYVRAYKGAIESNSSNTVNVATQACPPAVRATAADTRDGNWVLKSIFNPNDPIQWAIHVENTTASTVSVDLRFIIKNPNNVVIHDSTHTVGTNSGTQTWALPSTVTSAGGTYTFTGSVTYQGVKTERTTTYTVNGLTQTFSDVPTTHPYFSDIEILYANGFTAGCSSSPLMFCPDTTMNRGQAAVFMLRGNFGSGYAPPAPPWNTFLDDFSPGPWAQAWVQGMFNAGLTAGCSSNPMLYCPWEEMSRVQVAVFSLRLMHGSAYFPPPASGSVFADITDPNLWYAKWAEQAYADGLLPACGSSGGQPLFCPNDLVTRGLGAFSIVKAKNLTLP